MKIRQNFVSNSSSASFCIPKSELNEQQLKALLNYAGGNEGGGMDGWIITENESSVTGYTCMDNGYICDYMSRFNFNMAQYINSEW